MTVAGFYMRSLPSPPAIDFSSPQGKKLFTEALQNGSMEGFFKLISLFQTQSEPAYCGLATLAMVLNALSIDPCRIWKGPWRWFDETMLDWCEPLDKVKAEGISFGKVICLAHCAGANVEAFRTNRSSIDKFRKFVMACATSEDCHLISSYDRRVLKQTGTGHFSPIGGYHAESDMVLILDVARFKYPPHWVPLSILWEAMDTIDEATGLCRGFMLMSKNTDTEKSKGLLTQQQTIEPTNRRQNTAPSFLHTLSCKQNGWISTAKYFTDDAPLLLSSDNIKDTKDVILTIFSSLPSNFVEFIKCIAKVHRNEDGGQAPSLEEKGGLASKEEVLKLLQETSLYKHVTDTLSSESHFCKREQTLSHRDCSSKILIPLSQREPSSCTFDSCHCSSMQPPTNDVLTELLLALPPETWSAIKDENVLRGISGLVSIESLPSLLQDEVLHIRGELLVLKRCQYDRKEDGA